MTININTTDNSLESTSNILKINTTGSDDIRLTAGTTGSVVVSGIAYPTIDGANGDVLTTNGSGSLTFQTPSPPAGGGNNWLTANNSIDFGIAPVGTGSNSITLGNSADSGTDANNIAIGADTNTLGTGQSVAIGFGAAAFQDSALGGGSIVAIGRQAGVGSNFTQSSVDCGRSVFIGLGANPQSLTLSASNDSVAIGRFSKLQGPRNIAIGSLANCGSATITANDSIAIGSSAQVNADDSTALGKDALKVNQAASAVWYNNTTGIGNGASVSAADQVQLGNATTTTYVYGTVQNRSDSRDKTDITDTTLGLDFVNAVRPVDFRWDYREDYDDLVTTDVLDVDGNQTFRDGDPNPITEEVLVKATKDGSRKRNRKHHGVIAQEVQAVMAAQGVDFAGLQDHSLSGGCDVLSIGYDEFIAPLIKSVQTLSKQNTDLKALLVSKNIITQAEADLL